MRRPAELFEGADQRYGDVWTLRLPGGSNNVIVANPDLIKAVFTADTAVLGGASPPMAKALLGDYSLILLDGPEHRAQRKLIEPAFHREHVDRYRDVMARICEEELATWPLREPMELWPRMEAITLRAIMSAVFGVTGGSAQEELGARIRNTVEFSASIGRMSRLWLAQMRGGKLPQSFLDVRDPLDAMIIEEIDRARKDPRLAERDDILATLVQAHHDDGSPMSERELRDELVTLLIQGHMSTSSGLSWALERLMRHPEAFERLRAEAQTSHEEYLDAVVKETLRVRPPLPFPTRQTLQPYRLGEWELEPKTLIMINSFMLHRREDIYPEPERFRPERFLERPAEPYTWTPFGGGVRGCPGASFALCELKVVLRTIVQRVRLAPTEQGDEAIRRRAVGFVPSRGARAIVEERVPAANVADAAAR